MSSADEDRWDDPEGVYEYHLPFQAVVNREVTEAAALEVADHQKRILEANKAVFEALAAFERQKWYQTAYAKVRFALFWATYKVRLVFGLWLVKMLTKNPMNDPRLVSQKVWRRLGI